MRSLLPLCLGAALLLATAAPAQVKDGTGNPLGIGQPPRPVADFAGGTIGRGRAAQCQMDADRRRPCIFFPRNRDGSFAIDVGGMAYYADTLPGARITVDYDNTARMVPQGIFTRDRRDPACWRQGRVRRICIR